MWGWLKKHAWSVLRLPIELIWLISESETLVLQDESTIYRWICTERYHVYVYKLYIYIYDHIDEYITIYICMYYNYFTAILQVGCFFFLPNFPWPKYCCCFPSNFAGETRENEATAIAAAVVDESEASTFENEAPTGKGRTAKVVSHPPWFQEEHTRFRTWILPPFFKPQRKGQNVFQGIRFELRAVSFREIFRFDFAPKPLKWFMT